MNRWGYSVNIAMWEPINENEQVLGYYVSNLTTECDGQHPTQPGNPNDNGICNDQQCWYCPDCDLRTKLNTWYTDIISYVRNTVGDKHLFAASLGLKPNNGWVTDPSVLEHSTCGGSPSPCQVPLCNTPDYYDLFNNPLIDVLDVHYYSEQMDMSQLPADRLKNFFGVNWMNKPIHVGEYSSLGAGVEGTNPDDGSVRKTNIGSLFDNYDVPFHNSLWSSALSGSYSTGLSWQAEIVHWWPEGMFAPKAEPLINPHPTRQLGGINNIEPTIGGNSVPLQIANRKIHYNFKSLSDFFINSGIDLNDDLTPNYSYDVTTGLEFYYLVTSDNKAAYGWVHNIYKYFPYYYTTNDEEYASCQDDFPDPSSSFNISLEQNQNYDLTFYPTRPNQLLPDNQVGLSCAPAITIPINTHILNCDTASSSGSADFAFKIVQQGSSHRISSSEKSPDLPTPKINSYVGILPNPNQGQFTVVIPSEMQDFCVKIFSMEGQVVWEREKMREIFFNLDLSKNPKGIYFIQISSSFNTVYNKIILQ